MAVSVSFSIERMENVGVVVSGINGRLNGCYSYEQRNKAWTFEKVQRNIISDCCLDIRVINL